MEVLQNKLNKIDWDNDKSIKDFINNNDTDIFTGTNESGQKVIVQIIKGKSIKLSTMQDNNWIRINTYTIDDDDSTCLIREETYEK